MSIVNKLIAENVLNGRSKLQSEKWKMPEAINPGNQRLIAII